MFGNRSREMFLSVKVRWHEITDDCYSEIIEIQGVIEAVIAIVQGAFVVTQVTSF